MPNESKRQAGRPPSTDRVRIALIATLGSLVAFGVFGGFSGVSSLVKKGSSDPFDAMPKASFIVATVDAAELRRAPMYDALIGKQAAGADALRRALGVSALADACGFDPTTRIQRVAIAVPEDGERGEFGVAARVEVTREELEKCTRSLAQQRGGHAETRDVGSFVVLEDTSLGGATAPRLAYGRGGLLVASKGAWFDAMLGAADRTKPGARDAEEHVALRKSLSGREGFRAPTVLATAILPRSLRDRLKGEMRAELGAPDLSSSAMAGVLGVSAVGVAMHFGGPGENVDALVELVCDSPDACEAVEKLLQKKRTEWAGDLALRMIGFGALLDSVEVKREGSRLRASATASGDALGATIERVMKLRGGGGGGGAAPAAKRPDPKPGEGETIPGKRAPPKLP